MGVPKIRCHVSCNFESNWWPKPIYWRWYLL